MEPIMTKLLATTLAATLAMSSLAYAGGPVVIADEPEVVAQEPASSVGILPLLLVGIVLCVALCGGDDDEEEVIPPDEPIEVVPLGN
jgi:hypothetical protein